MENMQFMKLKTISDSRSVENISDKKLTGEVQPAHTNRVERVMRFVNVHLHCIVSNLKRISKTSTLHPLEKFMRTPLDALISTYFLAHKAWYTLVQFF